MVSPLRSLVPLLQRLCLKLKGKLINLTTFLCAKYFRQHGYKKRALEAFEELEKAGFGELITTKTESATVREQNARTLFSVTSHPFALWFRILCFQRDWCLILWKANRIC